MSLMRPRACPLALSRFEREFAAEAEFSDPPLLGRVVPPLAINSKVKALFAPRAPRNRALASSQRVDRAPTSPIAKVFLYATREIDDIQ